MTQRGVIAATLYTAVLWATSASAQQWQFDGRVGAGTGVEAGDPGSGSTEFRRARTRLLAAVSATIDERPENAYEFGLFAEVEPHTSLGAGLRLSRDLGMQTRGFVGAVGVIAPNTLLGGEFGVRTLLADTPDASTLFFEPSVAIIPLGSDIAGDQVLLWGLLSIGIHGPF